MHGQIGWSDRSIDRSGFFLPPRQKHIAATTAAAAVASVCGDGGGAAATVDCTSGRGRTQHTNTTQFYCVKFIHALEYRTGSDPPIAHTHTHLLTNAQSCNCLAYNAMNMYPHCGKHMRLLLFALHHHHKYNMYVVSPFHTV